MNQYKLNPNGHTQLSERQMRKLNRHKNAKICSVSWRQQPVVVLDKFGTFTN